MIRRLTLVTVASIAAIGAAGTAVAASGHAATTYKASLAAVNHASVAPRAKPDAVRKLLTAAPTPSRRNEGAVAIRMISHPSP